MNAAVSDANRRASAWGVDTTAATAAEGTLASDEPALPASSCRKRNRRMALHFSVSLEATASVLAVSTPSLNTNW